MPPRPENATPRLAPVVLFAYARPEHTRRTLEALSRNQLAGQSTLFVFCDGPRSDASADTIANVEAVRKIVRSREWCEEIVIHERDSNAGLAESIKAGVSSVLETHDRVIVLEDDIETSPGFLSYMNTALTLYENDDQVKHISGYLPRTSYDWMLPESFFARHMSCWGWGTWKRAWKDAQWEAGKLIGDLDRSPEGRHGFDLDGSAEFSSQLDRNYRGELKTWAIFWAASIYTQNGVCLFPGKSLVQNIGTDGTGENFRDGATSTFDVATTRSIEVRRQVIAESRIGRAYLRSFYRYGNDAGLAKRARLSLGRAKHRLASRIR